MKKLLIMMVACMALLSGCTESTIVKPTSETVVGDPNFETQENVEIDWTQVSTDAEDMFKDTSTTSTAAISISIWSQTRNRSC